MEDLDLVVKGVKDEEDEVDYEGKENKEKVRKKVEKEEKEEDGKEVVGGLNLTRSRRIMKRTRKRRTKRRSWGTRRSQNLDPPSLPPNLGTLVDLTTKSA